MGAIEPRPIEVLTEFDVAAGLALSTEAGWNQIEADWLFFLREGTVFGIRDAEGRVVATAALLPYGSAAWISLVLVTEGWRRLGLARALLLRCLARADGAELRTFLDATPAGAAVYRPLGFTSTADITRLRRPSRPTEGPRPAAALVDDLVRLDADAFGTDRRALLADLASRPGSAVLGDDRACCLVREGRRARHIGPVHARSQERAIDLLSAVAASEPGELVIDLSGRQGSVSDALLRLGFAVERPFERMMRRPVTTSTCTGLAVASAGPEYG